GLDMAPNSLQSGMHHVWVGTGRAFHLRLWALLEHVAGMQQDITRTLQGLRGRWAHPTLTPARGHCQPSPHTPGACCPQPLLPKPAAGGC
uniref:Uncharacterized protein n=1 Tax=Junco hyemalis TaxID=40217 RepID=A0A8C5IE24_JUNHY